jgi:hypothetical protein
LGGTDPIAKSLIGYVVEAEVFTQLQLDRQLAKLRHSANAGDEPSATLHAVN